MRLLMPNGCLTLLLVASLACGGSACKSGGDGRRPPAAPPVSNGEPAGEAGPAAPLEDGAPAVVESGSIGGFEGTPECVHPPVVRSCRDGLCSIPPGCFVMGTPRDSISAARYDNAEVEVRLTHPFVIGETEVTRAQWLALGLPEPLVDWRVTWETTDPNAPAPGQSLCLEPDCPVVWLSFEDAAAYANLRSETEGLRPCYLMTGCVRSPGKNMRCASVRVDAATPYECEGYRLPTEAEWEYAARAGTRTDLFSGDLDPHLDADSFDCALDGNLDRIGWYCGNSGDDSRTAGKGHPHPVAEKEPNGFGLYDVAGNAFEWVNDRYHPSGYGAGPFTDPVHGVEEPDDLTPSTPIFEGMADGRFVDGFPGFRVRRSGAFDLWSQLTGSGRRDHGYTATQHTGLRIARTVSAAEARP